MFFSTYNKGNFPATGVLYILVCMVCTQHSRSVSVYVSRKSSSSYREPFREHVASSRRQYFTTCLAIFKDTDTAMYMHVHTRMYSVCCSV